MDDAEAKKNVLITKPNRASHQTDAPEPGACGGSSVESVHNVPCASSKKIRAGWMSHKESIDLDVPSSCTGPGKKTLSQCHDADESYYFSQGGVPLAISPSMVHLSEDTKNIEALPALENRHAESNQDRAPKDHTAMSRSLQLSRNIYSHGQSHIEMLNALGSGSALFVASREAPVLNPAVISQARSADVMRYCKDNHDPVFQGLENVQGASLMSSTSDIYVSGDSHPFPGSQNLENVSIPSNITASDSQLECVASLNQHSAASVHHIVPPHDDSYMTPEERTRQRRMLRNRESAARSRDKRKNRDLLLEASIAHHKAHSETLQSLHAELTRLLGTMKAVLKTDGRII